MHGFIGHLDMHGIAISIGINGDRGDAHLAGCLDDAAGNLATIGDQNLGKHADVIPRVGRSFYGLCRRGQAGRVNRDLSIDLGLKFFVVAQAWNQLAVDRQRKT
jgi:hypothetical protein